MTESFVVSEKELGLRLDKLLTDRFPSHSRTYFQELIENEKVLINGLFVKKRYPLAEGDEVSVAFQELERLSVEPEAIELDILFEDDAMIVINKPAGMVVHPAPGSYSGTFANALMHHCSLNIEDFEELRPGIVHRLDKDTSGILVGAKTRLAHQKLASQFASRTVEKHYLAICMNAPKEGRFSAPIKRHHLKRKEMTIDPEGKEAISEFTLLAKKENLSLVEAKLITGRTHQIRVHLKAMNCPILGDLTYGIENSYAKRQMLHAHKLQLTHPLHGNLMNLIAPPPPDMQNFIDLIHEA